ASFLSRTASSAHLRGRLQNSFQRVVVTGVHRSILVVGDPDYGVGQLPEKRTAFGRGDPGLGERSTQLGERHVSPGASPRDQLIKRRRGGLDLRRYGRGGLGSARQESTSIPSKI